MWHGELQKVPLPAAVACNSPWLDVTQSSPTWEAPAPFDYLPNAEAMVASRIPECSVWPASPPRAHLYAADDLIMHPLASPIMSRSWASAPPMFICTGWEVLAHEDKFLAQKLAATDGIQIVFEEYEAMPHCFAMILADTPNARRCFEGWTRFIRTAVENPSKVVSSAVTVAARTLEETPLKFEELSEMKDAEMRARVVAKAGAKAMEVTAKL